MTQDPFALACDRLSHVVDDVQHERLRWSRNEGPKLARLVELAHAALESREEFELVQEGASTDTKRFVLKVHGKRVIGVAIWLDAGRAVVAPEIAARTPYRLTATDPIFIDYDQVDEAWMAAALQAVFSRVEVLPG